MRGSRLLYVPDAGGVTLNYSTISTNAQEGYGEVVMGTRGTLCVMNERDVMLFKEREPGDTMPPEEMYLTCSRDPATQKPVMKWTPSTGISKEAGLAKAAYEKLVYFTPAGAADATVNRGYFTELEAFAFAIRNPEYQVRCSGRVALADAVMALSANVSMRAKQPITFKSEWYDPASPRLRRTPPPPWRRMLKGKSARRMA